MKLNLARQTLYMLIVALVLMLIVFLFSLFFLIPEGKKYRLERLLMKKEALKEREYQAVYDETHAHLQQLRSDHKHVIAAFDNPFDPERFVTLYRGAFDALMLTPMAALEHNESAFMLYEVNTSSRIDSPRIFYDFLDQINKSEWVINVNFPIRFEREGAQIRSSFSMRVYTHETNATTERNTSGDSKR
ncbi:MAG: hypothetical protein JXK05_09330 [Campylobacterales bacterium]|nr:hypothetical protein [Campylobacterales bacterium]